MRFEFDPVKSEANRLKHGIDSITAKDFDELFDEGGDILPLIDTASLERPGLASRRVNVDFPSWVIQSLDQESRLIGVSRQSLIKLWISERLQQEHMARS